MVAVVENQAIVPFIDFIEFITQKALIEQRGQAANHSIFGNEITLNYPNDFEIVIFWKYSADFAKLAEQLIVPAVTNL